MLSKIFSLYPKMICDYGNLESYSEIFFSMNIQKYLLDIAKKSRVIK